MNLFKTKGTIHTHTRTHAHSKLTVTNYLGGSRYRQKRRVGKKQKNMNSKEMNSHNKKKKRTKPNQAKKGPDYELNQDLTSP